MQHCTHPAPAPIENHCLGTSAETFSDMEEAVTLEKHLAIIVTLEKHLAIIVTCISRLTSLTLSLFTCQVRIIASIF